MPRVNPKACDFDFSVPCFCGDRLILFYYIFPDVIKEKGTIENQKVEC